MIGIALDSNILIYLAEIDRHEADGHKIEAIGPLIGRLKDKAELFAPIQALGELFVVARRAGALAVEAREIVRAFAAGFSTVPSDDEAVLAALDLAVERRLQFWDSLIIAAAARAGCNLLLSEDMQDGLVPSGLTIVNPFADKPHPQLARLLA